MAIDRLPSNLYKGNAVVVNAMPYVQYAEKLKNERTAKDEALNQYYSKLGDSLNTAGVRKQDLDGENGGILRDIAAWKSGWMANKGNIKNGGAAQQGSMSDYQKILNRISQSKERAKIELSMGKDKFDGKLDPNDDDLKVIESIGKSIYDPSSYKTDGVTDYGYNDLSASVPDFDPAKQNTFFNAAMNGIKLKNNESNARVNKLTNQVYVPQQFNDEDIKGIAENAGNLFEGSKEAQKHYKKLQHNDAVMQDANKAFKSVYGEMAEINSPKDLAKADAIIRAKNKTDETEVTDFRERERIKNQYILGRQRAKSSQTGDNDFIDSFKKIDDIVEEHSKGNSTNQNPIIVYSKKENGKRAVYGGTPINALPEKEQGLVLTAARSFNNRLNGDDIYLKKIDGKIWAIDTGTNEAIVNVSEMGTNTAANKILNTKSREGAVEKAKRNDKGTSQPKKGKLD
jgi:hypothetical protein